MLDDVFKALLALLCGTIIGQWFTARYAMRNKQRELDINSALQFQQVYGEYKDIWRLWKMLHTPSITQTIALDPSRRCALLERASAAEAKVEAIVVKLALDRRLSEGDIQSIGLFRQSFQGLRQSIRDGESMRYNYEDARYRLFNDATIHVASLLLGARSWWRPSASRAQSQLRRIAEVRREQLEKELARYAAT